MLPPLLIFSNNPIPYPNRRSAWETLLPQGKRGYTFEYLLARYSSEVRCTRWLSVCTENTSNACHRTPPDSHGPTAAVPFRRLTEMNLLGLFHGPISPSAFSFPPSPHLLSFLIAQPVHFWSDFSHSLTVIIVEKAAGCFSFSLFLIPYNIIAVFWLEITISASSSANLLQCASQS